MTDIRDLIDDWAAVAELLAHANALTIRHNDNRFNHRYLEPEIAKFITDINVSIADFNASTNVYRQNLFAQLERELNK